MLYMEPVLKREEMEKLYRNSDALTVKHELWQELVARLKPVEEPSISDRYALLVKHSDRGRMLDFGCGLGKLTDQLKFFFDEIEGVEIDSYCAKHAEEIYGFKVYNESIENLDLGPVYDACMSYNNIEHLYDPEEVLRNLHACLKPGGIIYIECPNADSISIRCFKGRHHLLESNEHVNIFNAATLSRLLDTCGFEVLESRTRKLDVLCNDLLVYWLRRSRFYHRCSSPLLAWNSYSALCSMLDRVLARWYSRGIRCNPYMGSYIQMVAKQVSNV